jgi:hypothetical protein
MNILKSTNSALRKDHRSALVLRDDSTKTKQRTLKHGKPGSSRLLPVVAIACAVLCGLGGSVRAEDDLFVSCLTRREVFRFDVFAFPNAPAPFIGNGGGGEGFACLSGGNQAEIFVSNNTDAIKVYDPDTGAFLRTFKSNSSGGPQLNTVGALSLSPDGKLLYAADYGASGRIYAFDTSTGAVKWDSDVAFPNHPWHDVRVGPDGFVYATQFFPNPDGVWRFSPDLTTKTLFIPPGDNGLNHPAGMTFDRTGHLWVSNCFAGTNGNQVSEYDATTGAFVQKVVNSTTPGNHTKALSNPLGLDIGPPNPSSRYGDIYVASLSSNAVLRIQDVSPYGLTLNDAITEVDPVHSDSQPKYLAFRSNCVEYHKVGPRNLSTRLRAQPGANVGIGGIIITGNGPKHLLLRAIGPSLARFGVPDVLADPVLELHGPSSFATITNDNWRDNSVQEAAIIATGIPPTDDLESAIDATLNPGAYTAVVGGTNNTSGVVLIEVYDLSALPPSKLTNLSTRAFVGTSDNIVIAGFVLGGQNGTDRIAMRGIGPSLTAVGVTNALADPTLELRDGNGALLVANNDWQDDSAQAAQLTAAGLAPSNPLESGIAATLLPGTYTALLAGHNNGTGVGLVEFYDLGESP